MVFLMGSGIAGGVITSLAASLWLGPVGSLATAPLGGSLAALGAALFVASRRSQAGHGADPFQAADAQVTTLRKIAERGRKSSPGKAKARGRAA